MRLSPLNQRRWRNFCANRRAYWSFWAFLILYGVSLFAEFLANDVPIVVSYRGEVQVPAFRFYSEASYGGEFRTQADYRADDEQAGGSQQQGPVGLVLGPVVVVRDDGQVREQTETDGEGPAAGIDHRVTQDPRRAGGRRHHGTVLPGRDQCIPHRAVLDDRAQVHRRAADQVEEAGRPDPCDQIGVDRIATGEEVEADHAAAERGEVGLSGLDLALGVLVGRGGRQDEDLVVPAGRQEVGVESATVGERQTADQGQRTDGAGHGATRWCARPSTRSVRGHT